MSATRSQLSSRDYRDLHDFRTLIRGFLHFSEVAAQAEGLEPQQHQMLLAVRALTEVHDEARAPSKPTRKSPSKLTVEPLHPSIGRLAEVLLIRHHSAVGMIDRLAERGLLERMRTDEDRRQVRIRLTAAGETKLKRLSKVHHAELRNTAPALVRSLEALIGQTAKRETQTRRENVSTTPQRHP